MVFKPNILQTLYQKMQVYVHDHVTPGIYDIAFAETHSVHINFIKCC